MRIMVINICNSNKYNGNKYGDGNNGNKYII